MDAKRSVIALALLISACQSRTIDNSLITDPHVGVSFSLDVLPVLTSSCAGSECHVGETTNGVNLTNHAEIMASIGVQYGTRVVIPGNSSDSPLINKIGPGPDFGSRMPFGRGALSGIQISEITSWIDEGARNN